MKNWKKEYHQYNSQGYGGGKDGLRCDNCDCKYSGTSQITQLCPICMTQNLLDKQKKEHEILVNIILDEKNRILRQTGMLRQLVGEGMHDVDRIYEELNRIAPFMTEEQKKEFNEHISKSFNKLK